MSPDIHILDCTKLEVNLANSNYELSDVVKDNDGVYRGYKMGNLRGLTGDSVILEEATMGNIKTHDLKLCRPMLLTTPVLKPSDFLLNDRGFLDRETTNTLKIDQGVETFVPVKKNMDIYSMAVSIDQKNNVRAASRNRRRLSADQRFLETGRFQKHKIQLRYIPYCFGSAWLFVLSNIQNAGGK